MAYVNNIQNIIVSTYIYGNSYAHSTAQKKCINNLICKAGLVMLIGCVLMVTVLSNGERTRQ